MPKISSKDHCIFCFDHEKDIEERSLVKEQEQIFLDSNENMKEILAFYRELQKINL